MYNGFLLKVFQWGWLSTISTYFYTPLIILFTILACRKKQWLLYSVIVGVLFSIQFRSGTDMKVFMWDMLIFGLYLAFFAIGKDMRARAAKAGLIGIVVALAVFGLSAERILPIQEYVDVSSRQQLSFEQSSTRQLKFAEIPSRLIDSIYQDFPAIHKTGVSDQIGIIAFLLACLGVYLARKKRVTWYFAVVVVLSILIASGSFVYYFLWKFIPPFSHARYVDRSLVIFVFGMACLAGIGFASLEERLRSAYNFNKRKLLYVFLAVAALAFLDLGVFGYSPYRTWLEERNMYEIIGGNPIHDYIGKQEGFFRMHSYETTGIDWGTDFLTMPLGIEQIYGLGVAWLPDYLPEYLSFANRDPGRYWGILNVRYVTSTQLLNDSSFELIDTFEKCDVCFPETPELAKVNGPYLYRNLKEVPRAYMVHNAILVAGEKNAAKQLMYGLMAQPEYDPLNAVILLKEGVVGSEDTDFIKKVQTIVLAPGSVNQDSLFILQKFVDSGGVLVPDITKGQGEITQEKISQVLQQSHSSASTSLIPDTNVGRERYSKQYVRLGPHDNNDASWLVMSEVYSLTPGWNAVSDTGEVLSLMRANGVVTAVPIDQNMSEVVFEYLPKSYVLGKRISLASLAIVILFLGAVAFRARTKRRMQGGGHP